MGISRNRKSLWSTSLIAIAGLLVYVVIAELITAVLKPSISPDWLVPLGVVLALIPAVLWLAFFYAQDRLEPEPRTYVIAVAILGALLAAAVGQPLINDFFRVPAWIGHDNVTEILGSILIVGFVQAFLIYAAVRFSIYYSSEFDQRIDGVIYGTAAGIGYATFINIAAIAHSGGINPTDLSAGVIRLVVTALAQGSLGGLIGYFIARTKFDNEPVWWMPLGITLAAAIYGLYSWVSGEITRSRLTVAATGATAGYTPWPALILTAALAVVLFAIIFALMRRANALTLAGADSDQK
jgi:protease PrsW